MSDVFIKISKFFLILLAILLQKNNFCKNYLFLQPSWLYLLFMCFVIFLPKKISINFGFFLGLILDSIFDSILGIQSFILIVLIYLLNSDFFYFFNTCLFKQTMYIIFCFFILRIVVFTIKYFIFNIIDFNLKELLLNILVNGFIWPFFSLFLKNLFINKF